MAKKMRLSEEEAKMIIDYRNGLAHSENKDGDNVESKEKEDDDMKVSKKGLKIAGIAAAGAAALGGIAYGVYRVFFKDPSGFDDFDDFDEDNSDEFEDEPDTDSDSGLDTLTEPTSKA